uniref:Retrotransposon gag domain-containing protein n=1 Tax=Cannabis sativa TaxID=3483 RepID=A0A803QD01_CANSA
MPRCSRRLHDVEICLNGNQLIVSRQDPPPPVVGEEGVNGHRPQVGEENVNIDKPQVGGEGPSGRGSQARQGDNRHEEIPVDEQSDRATASIMTEGEGGTQRQRVPSPIRHPPPPMPKDPKTSHHKSGKEKRIYSITSSSCTHIRNEEMNELRMNNLRPEETVVNMKNVLDKLLKGHSEEIDKEMEDLRRRIVSAASEEGSWDEDDFDDEPPFSRNIQSKQLPPNFKEPNILPYEGIADPKYHLDAFNEIMKMKRVTSKARCQCFVVTLRGTTYKWFKRLSKDEHKMAIAVGVRPKSKLWNNMVKRELDDLEDFYERANRYILVEDGHENLGVGKSDQPKKMPAKELRKK